MRRLRMTLAVLATLAALALPILLAPAASADVVGESTHLLVAEYGNGYDLYAHLAVGRTSADTPGTIFDHLDYSRVHFHCRRNGAVWDGCRVSVKLVLQWQNPTSGVVENIWSDTVAYPGGSFSNCVGDVYDCPGWFADSGTLTNQGSGGFAISSGETYVRACVIDPDAYRFRRWDGTNVLISDGYNRCGPWTLS